jgi:hypothetical protein
LIASLDARLRSIPTEVPAESADEPTEAADDARLLTFAGLPHTVDTIRSSGLTAQTALAGLESIDALGRLWRGQPFTLPTPTRG